MMLSLQKRQSTGLSLSKEEVEMEREARGARARREPSN